MKIQQNLEIGLLEDAPGAEALDVLPEAEFDRFQTAHRFVNFETTLERRGGKRLRLRRVSSPKVVKKIQSSKPGNLLWALHDLVEALSI